MSKLKGKRKHGSINKIAMWLVMVASEAQIGDVLGIAFGHKPYIIWLFELCTQTDLVIKNNKQEDESHHNFDIVSNKNQEPVLVWWKAK